MGLSLFMHGFIVKDKLNCFVNKFWREYPEGVDEGEVKIDQIIIDTGGESLLVKKALEKKYDENQAKEKITYINEKLINSWQFMPARIGRFSCKIIDNNLHEHIEDEPLTIQCQILKNKNPNKKHFRIAIINGFGTNLGDALLGMTAMRHAAKVIEKELQSFSVDFLLGPSSAEGNMNLVSNEEWVGQISFQSPTLLEFSKYDAYLDYSNFISMPKFNTIPTIDWHLWWMGMDSEKISSQDKRNILPMPWKAWNEIESKLNLINGKKILFNHKASVPLRSFPPEIAVEFIKKLLNKNTEIKIILAQPLDITHPRVVNLEKILTSSDHFAALVCQMSAVICVDTYALHVADTASVPCVSIFSSLPCEIYPYYPMNIGYQVPGVESLDGYKKSKLKDDEWIKVKNKYEELWKKVSSSKILKLLEDIAIKEKNYNSNKSIKFIIEKKEHTSLVQRDNFIQLKYDATPEIIKIFNKRFIEIAKSILKPGMEALQIGASSPHLTKELLVLGRGLGKLHVYEPRKPQLTILNANFGDYIIGNILYLIPFIPMVKTESLKISNTDPFSDVSSMNWGNSRSTSSVKSLPIDEIDLNNCKLLILQHPFDAVAAIKSGDKLFKTQKPMIVMGPIKKDNLRAFTQEIMQYDYEVWVEQPVKVNNNEYLVISFYKENKIGMKGFTKVNIN